MEANQVRFAALEATLVSDPVRPILALGGHGLVHSVFGSVVNLELGGRLVTVTETSVDPLPNGVRVGRILDFRRSGLRPGLLVVVDGSRIAAPDVGLTVEISGVAAWSPKLVRNELDPSGDAARARWRSRSARVRALASARVSRRPDAGAGLGALILPIGGTPLPAVAALAGPRLARLGAALRDADAAGASDAALDLVGLGPGLTPSGDDALVGVAAAIAVLAGPGAEGPELLDAAASGAPARTTAVAATYLRHAAAGEFAGGIHRLLEALLGSEEAAVGPGLDRVLGWGATSGTDILVGVLAGLDSVAGVVAPAKEHPATGAAPRRAA